MEAFVIFRQRDAINYKMRMDKSLPFPSLRSLIPCDLLPPLQDTFEPKQSIQ